MIARSYINSLGLIKVQTKCLDTHKNENLLDTPKAPEIDLGKNPLGKILRLYRNTENSGSQRVRRFLIFVCMYTMKTLSLNLL